MTRLPVCCAALFWSATLRAESATAAAPLKAVSLSGLGQWLGALLLVLAALGAFAWLLRHMNPYTLTSFRHFRVLGGMSLGARERVVLLQAGRKQLVLGVAPGRVETLCVLEGEDRIGADAAEEAPAPSRFALQLKALMRGGAE